MGLNDVTFRRHISSNPVFSNGVTEFQGAHAIRSLDGWIREKPAFVRFSPCLVGMCLVGRAQARISAPHLPVFNWKPCAVYNLYSPMWQLPPACLVFFLSTCVHKHTCISKPLFSVPLPLPKHLLGYSWVGEMIYLLLGV